MPLYEYECSTCGTIKEEHRRMSDIYNFPICCQSPTHLIMSKQGNDWCSGYPYNDTVLGQEITSPSHRRAVMKKLGVEERG